MIKFVNIVNIVKRYWIACTLSILVAITILSLWPLDELPPVPGTDKIHHLIAYGLLALPAALKRPDNWIVYCILFIAYGGTIELIQPYVNRYAEWMDMFANTFGVICGVIIATLIRFINPVIQTSSE